MKVQEKIRFARELKNLSQEEVASKLGMSTTGYAKIERGQTKANIQKLEKIAEVLEIDLMELLVFGEKNVTFLIADNNSNSNSIMQSENGANDMIFKIDKLEMTVRYQQEMLNHKDKEITRLEEMLEMQRQLHDKSIQ
jgi:transcriptional regulator with XRE-family HTH domain